MSYQAEERYWTDYLRIALPIAGLLLLLGVFWYWASTFIGDDDNNPQTPVAAMVDTPITADSPTPTVSEAVTIAVSTAEPTEETADPAPTEGPDSDPTATTAPEGNGADPGSSDEFAEGDLVVVNDNDVNLRSDATTASDVVDTLIQGTELRILSVETVEADGYVWWNVVDPISELEGWIAGDLIDPL